MAGLAGPRPPTTALQSKQLFAVRCHLYSICRPSCSKQQQQQQQLKCWCCYCCTVQPIQHPPTILWQSPTQEIAMRGETWSVKCIFAGRWVSLMQLYLYLGFTIYLWWRLLFLSFLLFLFFLSFQTKFSGQTRCLYRYGPQVDLRTLTQFQWPWPTFQGHRHIFVPKTRNFKSI